MASVLQRHVPRSNDEPGNGGGGGSSSAGDGVQDTSPAPATQKLLLPPGKSQPYIAVLEDALDQLAVLGDITHEVGARVDGKQASGDETARIMKDQKVLESKYQRLVQEQNTLKALPNKTKYKESQLAIMDVTNELQQNTYVLARNLKSHPSVAQNLLKIQTERSTLQALISKTIRELKEYRFDSLSATVEEEYRKKNILKNTIQQEKAAMEMLKGLQRELGNEKVVLEEEKNERALVIQQLKDTIQEINALTTSEQKYIKKETKAHEASVRQQCQMKEQALQEEKANLQKQIEQELKAHDKIVEFLNHQRSQLEQQIQQWMVKYEEDTEAKAKELEDLKQRRAQDLDKYEELVVKYEELERIVEDDRETRRKVAEEQRELAVKDKACRRIQRWWRRLRSVKLVEAKSAKKPAKSAKKKGSGKKSAKAPKKGKK